MNEIFILGGARTPMAEYAGKLKDISAIELGAIAARAAMERTGVRLGQGQLEDTLWSALLDTHCGCTMAGTAENCAAKYGISREAQDAYAIRSQQLADKAWKEGRLKEEVVGVEIKSRKGVEIFAQDDHMRPD